MPAGACLLVIGPSGSGKSTFGLAVAGLVPREVQAEMTGSLTVDGTETRVLPLSLWTFQGEFSVNIPAVLASVVLSTLPILVLYVVGRRQLLSGLTAGFSK